jgi:hypothetical protein
MSAADNMAAARLGGGAPLSARRFAGQAHTCFLPLPAFVNRGDDARPPAGVLPLSRLLGRPTQWLESAFAR